MTALATRLHGTRSHAAVLLALLASTGTVFAVAFDQGSVAALAQAAFGDSAVHELFHDARHMLGFPCH